MRVITGEAKGRKLKGPPGPQTRPMQDKIKEALFSTLEAMDPDIDRVLDLYSGTGGIGIEALSRGASWADFVDHQRAACDVVRWNLEHTKLQLRAAVHKTPVPLFIRKAGRPYDLVILDPPYADPEIRNVLEEVASSGLVKSGTLIALGHWPKFVFEPETGPLVLIKRRCHGDSCFSVYEINPGVSSHL